MNQIENQFCPLCSSKLVLEYETGGELSTSSWQCPNEIYYLDSFYGEYSIVRATSSTTNFVEKFEYYYTADTEISVDLTNKTSSIFINGKLKAEFNKILSLDKIKQYMLFT